MAEEIKEHWSEWFDWTMFGIYETIYDKVPCNNWDVVVIEFEHKDGSISKAYMCPYEEWTDDDYWKSYELQDEHYNYPCDTSTVVKWRFLYDWKEDRRRK